MAVSAMPYVFSGNIDPSLMTESGQYPHAQWQYAPPDNNRPRSHTASSAFGSHFPDPTEVVSSASEKVLETNGHFVRYKLLSDQRASELMKMQDVVMAHVKENEVLRSENHDLKVANQTLKESVALFAKEYHENGRPSGKVASCIRSGSLPAKPASRNRSDFAIVKLWTRKDFRRKLKTICEANRGETDGNATSTRSKAKSGRPRKSPDDDGKTTHFYLENADGSPVDEDQITEMSRRARMLWRTLHEDDMAPETFGQISMQAWQYYSRMMFAEAANDFLLLCDDGEWKLREWSTRSYPSWHRNRFAHPEKEQEGNHKKAQDSDAGSVPPDDGDSGERDTGDNDNDNDTDTEYDNDNANEQHNGGDDDNYDDTQEQHTSGDDNNNNDTQEQHTGDNDDEAGQGTPDKDNNNDRAARTYTTQGTPPTSNPSGPVRQGRPSDMFDPFNKIPPTLTGNRGSVTSATEQGGSSADTTALPPSGIPRTTPQGTTSSNSPQATDNAIHGLNDQVNQDPPHPNTSFDNPRLSATNDGAKATEGRKRRAEGNTAAVPNKRPKRNDAVATPTAVNSIKNICMRLWIQSQVDGPGLVSEFEAYFKKLSDADKEPFKAEQRAVQAAIRKGKAIAKKTTDATIGV